MAAIPTLSSSLPTISPHASPSTSSKPHQLPYLLTLSSLFGTRITIQSSNSCRFLPNNKYCRATSSTVSFSLPNTKPQTDTPEKLPKWSARAIKSFVMAELEARKLKYPSTGTEALLMGILVEGTSKAAKFLRANGITLFKVQEETVELLGKSDMYYFSPEHPPLTEPAQKSLDWAVEEKLKSGIRDSHGHVILLYVSAINLVPKCSQLFSKVHSSVWKAYNNYILNVGYLILNSPHFECKLIHKMKLIGEFARSSGNKLICFPVSLSVRKKLKC